MKSLKVFLFAAIAICACLATSAQSTAPRWGLGNNGDNTGRALNYRYAVVTDTAGADTTVIRSRAWETIVRVNLLDSLSVSPVLTNAYAGDRLIFLATGTSGDKLKFVGSNWISAGAATLSSGLRAVVTFIFDGTKWVEKSRVVQ